MNPKNRAERVVALGAIENEAQKLAEEGADATAKAGERTCRCFMWYGQ